MARAWRSLMMAGVAKPWFSSPASLSAAHAAMRADLAEAARRGLTVPDLTEPTSEDTLHAARWLQDRGLVGCAAG